MYHSLRWQTLHYFNRPHQSICGELPAHPGLWRGHALRQHPEQWQYRFSAADLALFEANLERFLSRGRPLKELRASDFPLAHLSPRIQQWQHCLQHGRGFVLLRGLPVQRWGQQATEIVYWALGQHLGIPGAQNPQGDLLGHVRDQQAGGDIRLYRTNRAIDFHCDAADVVGLLCLRPAHSGGLSRLVSSMAIYQEVLQRRPDLIAELYRPWYFDTKGEGGLRAFPVVPCRYADGELRTFWQTDYYRSVEGLSGIPPLRPAQIELLDLYQRIGADPELHLDMELEAGDLQLVSNHSTLHARTAFKDAADPERSRHLLRLWLSLPQPLPLRQRWQRRRRWMSLASTAGREWIRQRLAA